MVKLTLDKDKVDNSPFYTRTAFYFYTMEECNEFINGFKDRWMNVPWAKPEEIPDDPVIISNNKPYMDTAPKDRVWDNIGWANALLNSLKIGMTDIQEQMLGQMIGKLGGYNS